MVAVSNPFSIQVVNSGGGTTINGVDPVADWQARSTASGVLLAENFSSYANSSELIAANAFQGTGSRNSVLVDQAPWVTSGKAVYIARPDTAGSSYASWNTWLSGGAQTSYSRLYIQVVIYHDFDDLDWCQATSSAWNSTPKAFIVDWFNGTLPTQDAEIVVDNAHKAGAITAYRFSNQANYHGFTEDVVTPYGSDIEFQNAIDRGTPANPTTVADWNARYGLTYNSRSSSYPDQGTSRSAAGLPWSPIVDAGGIWHSDDFTVVEIFYDRDTDTFQLWSARYGSPPQLVHSYVGTANFTTIPVNQRQDHILLTAYLTNGVPEPGRPVMKRSYAEVLTSHAPINFPGGNTPPNNQG